MPRSPLTRNVVGAGIVEGGLTITTNSRGMKRQWRGIQLAAILCLALASITLTLMQGPWFTTESVESVESLGDSEPSTIPIPDPVLLIKNKANPDAPFPNLRNINPPISRDFFVNPDVWKRAQSCLLDSPYVPEDVPSLLSEPSIRRSVEIELEDHYLEMLHLTDAFRRTQFSSYVNFSGPWLENAWIEEFCCNRSLADFGGLVPLFVPWTDSWLAHDYSGDHLATIEGKAFLRALRQDVIYITVIQMADGLFLDQRHWSPRDHWNILILSAGGHGHAPLPLFMQELAPVEFFARAPNVFVFAGKGTFPVRKIMLNVLENLSAIPPFFAFRNYEGKAWINVMRSGLLNLAPRGYGRSSFRTSEIIQLGLVPVYIYDDVDWSSYKGSNAHLSEFGFVVHIDEFESFVNDTVKGLNNDANYLKMDQRRAKILKIRESHFTMRGVLTQLKYFFLGDSRSDIACQRFPRNPTGNLLIREPPSNITKMETALTQP